MTTPRGMRAPIARVLGWWLNRQIRTGLDGVYVRGREEFEACTRAGPLVVACTHQSWWDGLVTVWVCRALGIQPMVLMKAENLDRWPFFEAFGAVGISGARGVRRCLKGLKGPGDVLWTFPQGTYCDPGARPLGLQKGTAWIARQAGAPILPVALGYRFGQHPTTRALMSFGDRIPADPDREDDALMAQLESRLIAELERISGSGDDLVVAGFAALDGTSTALVPPEPDVASRVLGWIWRWS